MCFSGWIDVESNTVILSEQEGGYLSMFISFPPDGLLNLFPHWLISFNFGRLSLWHLTGPNICEEILKPNQVPEDQNTVLDFPSTYSLFNLDSVNISLLAPRNWARNCRDKEKKAPELSPEKLKFSLSCIWPFNPLEIDGFMSRERPLISFSIRVTYCSNIID